MTWELFWQGIFIISVVLFAGMSVVVIIGGFFDVKKLLARYRDSR